MVRLMQSGNRVQSIYEKGMHIVLIKMIFPVVLLLATHATQAGIIEYNGYSREESSNVVTGNDLEWLKWDRTAGMSINEALAAYNSLGWTLATNQQMTTLFNSFAFGKTDWDSSEGSSQMSYMPWTSDETSPNDHFSALFGYISVNPCSSTKLTNCYIEHDVYTAALYGSDLDKNEFFKAATIRSDRTYRSENYGDITTGNDADLWADWWAADDAEAGVGVALVRTSTIAAPVSVPGTISLLAVALVALNYRRRQKIILNG
jgi:hypothetical protein